MKNVIFILSSFFIIFSFYFCEKDDNDKTTEKDFKAPKGWIAQNSGTTKIIYSIYFVDSLNGWMVASKLNANTQEKYDGEIIATNDGGKNWIKQYSTNSGLLDIHFFNRNHGLAVGDNGTILKTTNGGSNWNCYDDVEDNKEFTSVYIINKNFVWLTSSDSVYKLLNNKLINISIENDDNIVWINQIFFIDSLNGYIDEGYYTNDGGETWTFRNYFGNCWFVNPQLGWQASNDNNIYKTTDGGSTWTKQTTPDYTTEHRNDNLFAIFFTNKNNGWAGGYGRFYKTTDGGKAWENLYVGEDVIIWDIYFPNKNHGWMVANNGLVFKKKVE